MTFGSDSQLMGEGRHPNLMKGAASFGQPEMPPQFKQDTESLFQKIRTSAMNYNEPIHKDTLQTAVSSSHPPQPFTASWLTEVARMSPLRPPTNHPFSASSSDYYPHFQCMRPPFQHSFLGTSPYVRSVAPLPAIRPYQHIFDMRLQDLPAEVSSQAFPLNPYLNNLAKGTAKELKGGKKHPIRNFPTKLLHKEAKIKSNALQKISPIKPTKAKSQMNAVKPTDSSSDKSDIPESPFYPHFYKGSLIILSENVSRKVEDLQTSDFIHASEASQALVLDPSTVGAITSNEEKNVSTILFTFPSRNKEISVDASDDHPFFVFHKGWSSCNPEQTFLKYKLRVRQLTPGDVCVSLQKAKEDTNNALTDMPPPKTPLKSTVNTPCQSSSILSAPTTCQIRDFQNDKEVELKFVHTPEHASRLRVRPSTRACDRISCHEEPPVTKKSRKRRWSDPNH